MLLSGMGVGLTALAAWLLLARRALDSPDAQIMFTVAKSLAPTRTTNVSRAADPFGLNTPHSSCGLGQALLEVPAYLLAMHTGQRPRAIAMILAHLCELIDGRNLAPGYQGPPVPS